MPLERSNFRAWLQWTQTMQLSSKANCSHKLKGPPWLPSPNSRTQASALVNARTLIHRPFDISTTCNTQRNLCFEGRFAITPSHLYNIEGSYSGTSTTLKGPSCGRKPRSNVKRTSRLPQADTQWLATGLYLARMKHIIASRTISSPLAPIWSRSVSNN